jgi:hypothetical protein
MVGAALIGRCPVWGYKKKAAENISGLMAVSGRDDWI